MRPTMHVDVSGLKAELARLKGNGGAARQAALVALASAFADELDDLSPDHTGRYRAAWAQAANEAGLPPRPVPPIRPSPKQPAFLRALQRQVTWWERGLAFWQEKLAQIEKWDEGRKRHKRIRTKWGRRVKSEIRFAEKRLARAREELAKAQAAAKSPAGFLIMDEGHFGRLDDEGNEQRRDSADYFNSYTRKSGPTLKRHDRRRLTTVRTQVYGGRGRMVTVRSAAGGSATFVELGNLEPHARIVETLPRFGHPVRTAFASVRTFGIRRASAKYMDEVAKGTALGRRMRRRR